MIEVLEFIFQSFWHFVGTLLLLETAVGGLRGMVRFVVKRTMREGDRWTT